MPDVSLKGIHHIYLGDYSPKSESFDKRLLMEFSICKMLALFRISNSSSKNRFGSHCSSNLRAPSEFVFKHAAQTNMLSLRLQYSAIVYLKKWNLMKFGWFSNGTRWTYPKPESHPVMRMTLRALTVFCRFRWINEYTTPAPIAENVMYLTSLTGLPSMST